MYDIYTNDRYHRLCFPTVLKVHLHNLYILRLLRLFGSRGNTNTIEKFKNNSETASNHILKIISELKPKHYRNATVKYQKIISYFVLFDNPFTEMLACTTFTDFFAPSFFSWMIQMHSVDWVTFTGLVIVSFRLVTTPPQVEAAQNKTIHRYITKMWLSY